MQMRAALAITVSALLGSTPAAGQTRPDPPPASAIGDTVTVVPSPGYAAGGLHRTLFGDGWREVWLAPVDAPVFGLGSFAGGVEWTRRGGGNQSITLHLRSVDGWREYIFRSADKFPEQAMPPEVRGTFSGWIIKDLISSFFPAAPLMVPPIMEAVELLHVEPALRVLPYDPRLGVYADTFAGMLGTVELKPNEAPGDEPGFAGSRKIKGTEEFVNDLEESKGHRLDEDEFLTARLVDFLINDTDRTQDNVRWARYGRKGNYRWRPIPIDRDWAFVDGRGWITSLLTRAYPKLVPFGPDFPPIERLTHATHVLDRRMLQRLTREDFQEAARGVRAAVTDEVIEAAVREMPARWRSETGAPDRIRGALHARRDHLEDVAGEFYELLATDVDIRGTDGIEHARVHRFADGRVRVTLTWRDGHDRAGESFYDRTFSPSETDEVRLYLLGGDDRVRLTGEPTDRIIVRIIGGKGDDVFVDEAGGGATRLYDSRGENRAEGSARHRIRDDEWVERRPPEGLRLGSAWAPDWGGSRGWRPALDYGDAAGVVVGLGPAWTRYGFRRLPYHWKLDTALLFATGDRSFGAEVELDYRLENSPLAYTLGARAAQFHAFRFYGLGNDSDDAGEEALVPEDHVAVRPALTWHIGWMDRDVEETYVGEEEPEEVDSTAVRPLAGRLDAGPILLWSDPRPRSDSPFADGVPAGSRSLLRAGVRARLELDRTDPGAAHRRGWRLEGSARAFPRVGDVDRGFVEGDVAGTAYVPLPIHEVHVAVRGGASAVTAGAPLRHSTWVGGRTTLRGYRWQRYRGDAAAFGSAELRVPVTPVELLVRWNLGVFGLADVGRVWDNGESPGGWHSALGGGVWLAARGTAVSAAYAHGEEGRFYLQLGLPY